MSTALPSTSGRAWADPSSSGIDELIRQSRSVGWRPALEALRPTQPFFVKRMEQLSLANWHVLIGNPTRRRSLDIGCGFGSLVLGMQDAYDASFGVEFLPERVAYGSLRAEQDRRACRFLRGSGLTLPLRSGRFDLVTLNGVLEWAGLYADGAPEANQQQMLGEAKRVLAPGGCVAVAIENRYALESLVGLPDTHTGLLWVTAMPRALANVVSQIRKREPYRTYLYSLGGYRRLFQRAGFPAVRVLDLVSSYNDYDFVVDPSDTATYRFLLGRGLVRPFVRMAGRARRALARMAPALLGQLSYAYLVLAGETATTLLDGDSPLWPAVGASPGLPGRHRFAIKGERPGELAIAAHDGNRLTGLVELSAARTGFATREPIFPSRLVAAFAPGLTPGAAGIHAGLAWRTWIQA